MNKFYLRALKESDADRMLSWIKDGAVTQYLLLDGSSKTISDVRKFIAEAEDETKHLHRAISSEDGQYYGTVSLKNIDRENKKAEFAITLHPEAMGSGAAQIASREILRIGFTQLKLDLVYLNVIEKNIRAVRLYEGLGFCYKYTTQICFKGNNAENLRWYEIDSDRIFNREDMIDLNARTLPIEAAIDPPPPPVSAPLIDVPSMLNL